MDIQNVIIIGGGPAGLSAALYLARANLRPLVFAGSPPGGQLMLTSEVENFPGQESILGSELIEVMRKQATNFGTTILDENVKSVELGNVETGHAPSVQLAGTGLQSVESVKLVELGNVETGHAPSLHKTITSASGKTYQSKALIIATGAKALWMGLPSETRLRGKGVSACATCDGFFFKNKIVAVVGGGDSALEEALTLTKFATKVYIVHRRGEFKASKIMQDRVFQNKKIEVLWNSAVEEILGENKVEGIKIKMIDDRSLMIGKTPPSQTHDPSSNIHHLSSDIYHLTLNGVFVAIGHRPDTDLFKEQIELDEKGYVITTAIYALSKIKNQKSKIKNVKNERYEDDDTFDFNYQTMTSSKGVFGAGDCVDHVYRQAATAAGMGVAAALDAERYLTEI